VNEGTGRSFFGVFLFDKRKTLQGCRGGISPAIRYYNINPHPNPLPKERE